MIPDGDVCFSFLDHVTKGHLWIIVTEQPKKKSTFILGSTSKLKMGLLMIILKYLVSSVNLNLTYIILNSINRLTMILQSYRNLYCSTKIGIYLLLYGEFKLFCGMSLIMS